MPNGVSRFGKGIVEQELTSMFESKWIRAIAKETFMPDWAPMSMKIRL